MQACGVAARLHDLTPVTRYWLIVAALIGAVLIALFVTALGLAAAVLWVGVCRMYRRCLPRLSGA